MNKDFLILVFISNEKNINYKCCGKNFEQYMFDELKTYNYKKITTKYSEQLLNEYVDLKYKYTIIFNECLPLLTKQIIEQIIEFVSYKELSYCKLKCGFVFLTAAIDSDMLYYSQSEFYDSQDFLVPNTFENINTIKQTIKSQIIDNLYKNGVEFNTCENVSIDYDCKIESGAKIENNVIIKNNSTVFSGAIIGSGTVLDNTIIHKNVNITNSNLQGCEVKDNCKVGPYARIRKGTIIGKNCKIGNFVEIKNSKIGDNNKISHLTYIGDCKVGNNCNFGCGSIICNYDGKNKYQTDIGDNVFIGSNANLIAPLKVESDAYIACGSTITEDVKKGQLAIARLRQVNKDNFISPKDR